jgi:ubiquinone/menaquinone biosynthesis C-methylase UbiE
MRRPSSEPQTMETVRSFLRTNVEHELKSQFGVSDAWVEQVSQQWFDDDNNYDGRWPFLEKQLATSGRLLDIAAGCGTFLLYGLRRGYDVYGIEPESWKRAYFSQKVAAAGHPSEWVHRLVDGVGEHLPWPDQTFDVVTSYQTLEHVSSVAQCLSEMFRVLRPGGSLHVRAPDYRSFYEPHYRLPFLPRMNRRLAALYLRALGRPTAALATLNWITEEEIRAAILHSSPTASISSIEDSFEQSRQKRLRELLPSVLHGENAIRRLSSLVRLRSQFRALLRIGREEKQMDLWVTKAGQPLQLEARRTDDARF